MRRFEIIDRDDFIRDIPNGNYDDVVLPKRGTISSAGYDFYSVISVTLKPGERKVIPTGIRVMMNNNEFLGIFIRSSLGFKYNVRMCNQVGIIDSDYFDNPDNEGHLFIKLYNEGNEEFCVKKHDRLCQGIFTKFLTVSNEEEIKNTRTNGFGSTNKGE